MTTATMIVMEPGSDWPGHIGDSTHVVAFSHGSEDLLQRTEERLGALRRRNHGVHIAVLACNAATGSASAGRPSLARTLLGAVSGTSHGRLILCASSQASHQLRRELFALTGTLTEEIRGTTASVSLKFTSLR
jgi:glutamate racemase